MFRQPTSQYAPELAPTSKVRPMFTCDHGSVQSSSHIYVGANSFRVFAFANTATPFCRGAETNECSEVSNFATTSPLSKTKNQFASPPAPPVLGPTWANCWENFENEVVVPDEWRENFRMSRSSLLSLSELLRPYIEAETTVIRSPVGVIKKVACTLYYLSDKCRLHKTANAFSLS